MAVLNLLSVNIRGLNHNIKRKRFLAQLHRSNPDICFIQETHLRKDADHFLKSRRYEQQFHSLGSLKARGVSILIKNTVNFKIQDVVRDLNGRFIFLKGLVDSRVMTFASLYAPNEGQISFLRQALLTLSSFSQGPVIVAEDLNYVVDLALDKVSLPQLQKQ